MSGTSARRAALPAAAPYPPSPDLRIRRAAGPNPTSEEDERHGPEAREGEEVAIRPE